MIDINIEQQEAEFQIGELFISRTDKRGIIEYCNSVFTRISGYSEEQLIGAPHKIIRHRDMPKSIFKIFWNKLQANESVVAYVKNRAADGKYYWVLATAYPSPDQNGYLSIRIKPLSSMLEKVKELYKHILQVEQEKGLDEGVKVLMQEINKMGFATYEEFMIHSIYEEFSCVSPTKKMKSIHKNNSVDKYVMTIANIYMEMRILFTNSSHKFSTVVYPLKNFLQAKSEFENGSLQISQVCERLEFLSVNMSISAHKLGKLGGTLSVVASSFQTTAQKIVKDFDDFQKKSNLIVGQIQNVFLSLACSTVQNEMLGFATSEILEKLTAVHDGLEQKPMALEIEHAIKQTEELLQGIDFYFMPLIKDVEKFYALINSNHRNLIQLGDLVTQLDLIKTGGKLEGSRSNEIVQSFEPFIIEMNEFIDGVQQPVNKILYLIKGLENSFMDVLAAGKHLEFVAQEMQVLLRDLKKAQERYQELQEVAI